jgi:hypothetical protein
MVACYKSFTVFDRSNTSIVGSNSSRFMMQGLRLRVFCSSSPCDGRFPVQAGLKIFKRFVVSEVISESEQANDFGIL